MVFGSSSSAAHRAEAMTSSTATNFHFNGWCLDFSFGWLLRGQAKFVLIKRDVCMVEDSIAAFLHQLVPSMSLVVPKELHLLFSVVKLLPLGRWDQGIGNTAKHSQIAEIWLLAVSNFMGAFILQGGGCLVGSEFVILWHDP